MCEVALSLLFLGLRFGPGQARGHNLSAVSVSCKYFQYCDKSCVSGAGGAPAVSRQ